MRLVGVAEPSLCDRLPPTWTRPVRDRLRRPRTGGHWRGNDAKEEKTGQTRTCTGS
jgi:hypothetical protein